MDRIRSISSDQVWCRVVEYCHSAKTHKKSHSVCKGRNVELPLGKIRRTQFPISMMLCNSRCEFDGGIKEWGRVSSRTKWHTDCVSQQSACYILHFLFSRVYPGGSIYICYTVQMLIFYPKENLTRACRPASRSVRPWNFLLSVVYFRFWQKPFLIRIL